MNRLTRKDHKPRVSSYEYIGVKEVTKKLGVLEDWEEKLGIDLNTFVSLIIKDFYVKDKYGYIKKCCHGLGCNIPDFQICSGVSRRDNKIVYKFSIGCFTSDLYELRDCGKTWALTRDVLEKGGK